MDARITLDLNDVSLFVRVVQAHSFAAAARAAGLPASTVSRRIARLEAALGTRLLERTTRHLALTDAGRAYFAEAERAVDGLAQGADRIRALQTEARGRVRILAPIVLGTAVSSMICRYLAAHPGVSIDLELDQRPVDLLAEGFDIAIIGGKIEGDSGDFVARPLWRPTRKLLFASPRYLEARGAPRTVEDLPHHDCIVTRVADGRATWTLVAGRRIRTITFEPRFYVNESSAAHRAALAGVGIAMLPEVLCAGDVAAARLVRVLDDQEGESGGVSLLYRAHRTLTAAVRACVAHFLEELPSTDPTRGGEPRARVKSANPPTHPGAP